MNNHSDTEFNNFFYYTAIFDTELNERYSAEESGSFSINFETKYDLYDRVAQRSTISDISGSSEKKSMHLTTSNVFVFATKRGINDQPIN